MEKLPLNLADGRKLTIDKSRFSKEMDDLDSSLTNKQFLNNLTFSKKVMFSHEIKSNNNIEGITDGIDFIKEVILEQKNIKDKKKRDRIINLYKAYQYILEHKDINKNSLRILYGILSDGLLKPNEISDMGEFYRTRTGIILHKGRLTDYEDTISVDLVHEFMDSLFQFINLDDDKYSQTEIFIKSQIIHFYLVYIHPYFDINGRTSRTLAMWYLLNNKTYPYIIFNRAINFEFPKYNEAIIEAKQIGNVTYFIKNMLICVKKELEKEFIIEDIRKCINSKLSTVDYQTLKYILSMKGIMTFFDFTTVYNRDNDKKRIIEVYNEMILPLLEKNIIKFVRYTNNNSDIKNFEFVLNSSYINNSDVNIKYLK